MQIRQEHVEKLGFKYVGGWADCFVLGAIQLYNNPFKHGWTVESAKPNRQIYSVRALQRLVRKNGPNSQIYEKKIELK